MDQTLWKANSHSPSQEISHPHMEPELQYCVHKSLSLIPILIQMNPVHTTWPYSPMIYLNNTLLTTPRSFEWSLPFSFFMHFSSIPYVLHIPSILSLHDLTTQITFLEACSLWSSSLHSLLQPTTASYVLGPNILLSTVFLHTFNLCSSLCVWERPNFTTIQNYG